MAIGIRRDIETVAGLRRRAKKEPARRTALRMLAIANAMDGIRSAVRPASGESFALVPPHVCAEAMSRFLADFSGQVPAGAHAVMVLDGAG